MDSAATLPPLPLIGPARILVVEDEPALLRCFARILRPHLVELASCGAVALAMLADRAPFDVVLCDLTLPDISGRDVYRRACARWPELGERFLFMTGDRSSDARGVTEAADSVSVIAKPFTPHALHAAIHHLLCRSGPPAGGTP